MPVVPPSVEPPVATAMVEPAPVEPAPIVVDKFLLSESFEGNAFERIRAVLRQQSGSIADLLKEWDADNSGTIDRAEFGLGLAKLRALRPL